MARWAASLALRSARRREPFVWEKLIDFLCFCVVFCVLPFVLLVCVLQPSKIPSPPAARVASPHCRMRGKLCVWKSMRNGTNRTGEMDGSFFQDFTINWCFTATNKTHSVQGRKSKKKKKKKRNREKHKLPELSHIVRYARHKQHAQR